MENKGFSEIRQKCYKFKKLLLDSNQNKTVDDIIHQVDSIAKNRQVLSLSKIIQLNNKTQIQIPQIQEPGTSCYSSDMCSDDEPSFDKTDDEKKHKKTLTYTQIESMLIDEQSFEILDQQKNIWVLIQDIRKQLDYYEFVNFLENLQKTPEIIQLYFCFYQEKYSVIIQFSQFKQMDKFCNSCFKGLTNFLALLGNNFKIIWINPLDINSRSPSNDVDLIYYGALKKRKKKIIFFGKNFVGVVIRNYPPKYDCNELKQLLKKKIQVECKLKQQIEFKKQRFALLTFDTIEDAEKAICWIKERSTESDLQKLKVNLHSYSNFTRDPLIKNLYGNLFKNDISKDKIQQILSVFEIKSEDNEIQQTLLKDPKDSINFESEPEEGEINKESLKKKDTNDNFQQNIYQTDRRPQYRRHNSYYGSQQAYEQQRVYCSSKGKTKITKPPAPKEILPPKQIIIAPMIIKPAKRKSRYAVVRSGPDIYSNAHGFLGPPYSPNPSAYTGMPFNYTLKAPPKSGSRKLKTFKSKKLKKEDIRKLLSQLTFKKTNNDTDAFNDYFGLEHQEDFDFGGKQINGLEGLEQDKVKNFQGVLENYYSTKVRPQIDQLKKEATDLAQSKAEVEENLDKEMDGLIQRYQKVKQLEKELNLSTKLI